MRVMRKDELFDAEHVKTKIIFMSVQLLYTAATLSLAFALWGSFRGHLAYVLSIVGINVWNGGSYYIEVFSRAYRKQFEGVDAEARRRLQMALMDGTIELEQQPAEETEPLVADRAGANDEEGEEEGEEEDDDEQEAEAFKEE